MAGVLTFRESWSFKGTYGRGPYLRLSRTTASKTPRNRAYTSNQLLTIFWHFLPFACLSIFTKGLHMMTTTEFPFSCRMIFRNWLEMCLHPCDVESTGSQDAFHMLHSRGHSLCGVPAVPRAAAAGHCGRCLSLQLYLLCQFYFTTNAELNIHFT